MNWQKFEESKRNEMARLWKRLSATANQFHLSRSRAQGNLRVMKTMVVTMKNLRFLKWSIDQWNTQWTRTPFLWSSFLPVTTWQSSSWMSTKPYSSFLVSTTFFPNSGTQSLAYHIPELEKWLRIWKMKILWTHSDLDEYVIRAFFR